MARSKVFSTLLFVLLVVVPSSSSPPVAVASSRFYFPHFVSGNEAKTTFVISNSGDQDAEVVFTAYDDNGYLIAEGANPASATILAQSQAHIDVGELFKIRSQKMVTGWVKAESVNPELSAWILMSFDSIPGDKLDGLVVSDLAAKRMVFSAVFQGPDIVTGIGIANPDAQAAHVKASLYSEGRLAEVREFQIPAYGHRAWLLHELFESNVIVGHVEIDSDVGIVGFQEFSQPHQWSAAPMQLLEEASNLVFSLPALDQNLWAGIALANLGDFDLDFTLTAWDTSWTPFVGPVQRVVKPHGELITLVSDLFGDLPSAGGFISIKVDLGPGRIFGAKPALSGLAVVGRADLSALASFSLTQAWSPDKDAGNLVRMNAGLPLTSLQIVSSEQGFFIIPRQTFKARAVLPSSGPIVGNQPIQPNAVVSGKGTDHNQMATINADKDKDKDKDKCKDKDNKDKDKDKDKDKCKIEPANQAPTVNAGPDQTITLPNSAILNGRASDDGLPTGGTLRTTWTKVTGPGTVTFGNADALSTTATFSLPGTYVLRLTATDGSLTASDDVSVVAIQLFITDSGIYPPPTSGVFAYASFRPGAPGFPALGQSYVDPVFGSVIRRLTDEFPKQSNSQIYAKNGWWNADGTRIAHEIPGESIVVNVLDPNTGALIRSAIPQGDSETDASFDPVDPKIWYYFSGNALKQFDIQSGVSSTVKTFPGTLQSPGGSVDWIDRTGRYFLVLYNNLARIWDKQTDTIYSGGVDISTFGAGWIGITPSGNHIVLSETPQKTSYVIDHATQTVATGTMFWSLCGDHGDLISASDGKDYFITFECNDVGAIYRVDVTIPQSAGNVVKQRTDNLQLLDLDWPDSDGHFSCTTKGANQDWCYVSIESNDDTFASIGVWRPYKQEILMVQVTAPYTVRRLAHHRSRNLHCPDCIFGGYLFTPRVSASWDGLKVAWASNYGYDSRPGEYVDIYEMEISLLSVSNSHETAMSDTEIPQPNPPDIETGDPSPTVDRVGRQMVRWTKSKPDARFARPAFYQPQRR